MLVLRDADDLVVPAVRRTVKALDPPEEDAAMVTLALSLAFALDEMTASKRDVMIAQVSGQLMRVLKELDDRARRRRQAGRGGRVNRVAQLRAAEASRRS